MLLRRVIPVLLVKDGGLVKTKKFRNPVYIGDPINTVKIFNDKEVDELVVLDIDASKEGRGPNFQMIKELTSECFMPIAYGGGIHTYEQARQVFNCGVEKISLNSAALLNPGLITEIAKNYGSQSLIVSMDIKKNLWGTNQVLIPGGKTSKLDPVAYALQAQEYGAGEILLNSVERDGTYLGYDLPLIKTIASVLQIPIVACGGAKNVADFALAIKNGASAVAAGSMFVFHGPHQAVLINFPTQQELKESLSSI
jgi:cyclase